MDIYVYRTSKTRTITKRINLFYGNQEKLRDPTKKKEYNFGQLKAKSLK